MFYNTTGESGEQLEMFKGKAKTQDQIVLRFFKSNPKINYSPSQVWRLVFQEKTPLTSVRRSMTNLTGEGLLCQADEKRQGIYGRPEKTWRLL